MVLDIINNDRRCKRHDRICSTIYVWRSRGILSSRYMRIVSTLLAVIQIIKSRRALSIVALVLAIIIFIFAIVTVVLGTKGIGMFAPQE